MDVLSSKIVMILSALLCVFVIFFLVAAFYPVEVTQISDNFVFVKNYPSNSIEFLPRDWEEYHVQNGDTWWDLAEEVKAELPDKYDYDTRNLVTELLEYNGTKSSILRAGEVILLPKH